MADKSTIKIKDPDSGEIAEFEECVACNGIGGHDVSIDPEAYDDWQNCIECNGDGIVEVGHFDKDSFVPERDAFTAND